jgi:hypothetical protein
MPSPTNTVGASAVAASTIFNFPSGWMPACTSSMPTMSASHCTSLARSPETSITRDRPWAGARWLTNDFPSARGASRNRSTASVRPSTTTTHSSPPAIGGRRSTPPGSTAASFWRLVMATVCGSWPPLSVFTRPVSPCPGFSASSSTSSRRIDRSAAACTTAAASGCFE